MAWADRFLRLGDDVRFEHRARLRIFLSLLVLGIAILSLALGLAALRQDLLSLAVEAGLLALTLVVLGLLRTAHRETALALFGLLVPVALILRYFTLAGQDGVGPDYLLAYGLVSLVAMTLVTTRPIHLLVVWVEYAVAGAWALRTVVTVTGGQRPVGQMAVRYYLLMTLTAGLLALLMVVLNQATRIATHIEHRLEDLVAERTRSLEEAQQRLDRARATLASAEKSSSLGRLVARVAHEVNTPLAAIQASAGHLAGRLTAFWSGMRQTAPPTAEELVLVDDLFARAQTNVEALDPRQGRERRRRFALWLQGHGVEDAETLARRLADLGVDEVAASWLPTFRGPRRDPILDRVENLVDYERSVSVIGVAASKATGHVRSLRRFLEVPSDAEATRVDVGRNIETVLLLYRHQWGEGVEVDSQLPSQGPWVKGHPDRLMQVWSNLLLNAAQALRGRGQLRVEGSVEGAEVVVRVVDDGPGIPIEVQDRILDPFFTTKEAEGGQGLGLDICRTIVQEHRGRLTFTSKPGHTVFEVRFPKA